MKNIVILSGAGVSAESGISTFRDADGLWEQYRIEDVATPEAWENDYKTVLEFYNLRRKSVVEAVPNSAHKAIASLQKKYTVNIITQNIDDLHERAGSKNVLHLHGEIQQAKSSNPETLHSKETYFKIKNGVIEDGEKCKQGFQIRPHVVWFGEPVPNLEIAEEIVAKADILLVIGTSLNVYPAANLIHYSPPKSKTFVIDPNPINISHDLDFTLIQEKATTGIQTFIDLIK